MEAVVSQLFQQALGVGEPGEAFFIGPKKRRVKAAAVSGVGHRMPQMEHFVIEDVFDQKSRRSGTVENLADNDGIVGDVKMAQNRA